MKNVSTSSARTWAGSLLSLAGVTILMGIITAEALYPANYTTADNEISDLGATRPPDSIILQPSATIFDLTMVVTGVMLIGAAYFLHRAFHHRGVSLTTGLLGLGVLGVGIFPGNVGQIHPWFALTAFIFGGIAAILSSRVTKPPLSYASIVLGTITLTFLFGASGFIPLLGDGGTERWVAYPVVLWMVGFGGYLLARPK